MKQSPGALRREMAGDSLGHLLNVETEDFEDDLRWQLTQRIVESPQFVRSPLLSKFLLHVVQETLAGRQSGLTEHQIGVTVFGRPVDYRTDEDNIVRNYARQLRKRLADYFATAGYESPMRIEIPVGGYVASFSSSAPAGKQYSDAERNGSFHGGAKDETNRFHQPAYAGNAADERPALLVASPLPAQDGGRMRASRLILPAAAYSVVLMGATWLAAWYFLLPHTARDQNRILWRSILSGTENTYIVPPDAGFNILEDMSHSSLSLANYIKGSYLDLPEVQLDSHTNTDLRSQQFTDFVSLQIVAALARQPEYNPRTVLLRFPRDLRLDDLKNANAILIGSATSNPWAAIANNSRNFRIVPNSNMQGASVVNSKPLPGEQASYASHWNEPSHETYALISYLPNLDGSGHLLLLEGLDVAGTQAAAEFLFRPGAAASILKQARNADGTLRPFEILLRTTSIQSSAAGTQIVASRIH